GLVGFFGFNLVTWIFGFTAAGIAVTRIIYVLVGLAGVYGIFMGFRLAQRADDVCVPGHLASNL
ncbi:MAG: DUF378 domain-containing protein, partial [Armatimonadetes bacterium]|nr:DUF378 domain-containing protein [Armatimonadota bacterium]